MTAEQFAAVMRERIPTPEEFVLFVEAQGWTLHARDDGSASLRGPRDDVAIALAKMLGREPYRTNVLAIVRGRQPVAANMQAPTPPKPLDTIRDEALALVGRCRALEPLGFLDHLEYRIREAAAQDDQATLTDAVAIARRVLGNITDPQPPAEPWWDEDEPASPEALEGVSNG